jgi:hypothetical protein
MPHGHTSSEIEGQGDIIVVTVAEEEKQPMDRNFRGGLQTRSATQLDCLQKYTNNHSTSHQNTPNRARGSS